MTKYLVTVVRVVRIVVLTEAKTPEEARAQWRNGMIQAQSDVDTDILDVKDAA